ncbi:MAG: hypothetical protein CME62_05520 [Halobacteriovoraceae bacterium]|nr:hypothetical protein [Halobacteriovoraceae bacterium]|tara:strand:+ start:3409 stop:4074 length:666 start_codon:yes stop_codon:yes gene_type:complete
MVRVIFYLLLVVLTAVSVNWKIGVIEEKRAAEVISINNEYSKHGKPVEIFPVVNKNLEFFERVSGEYSKGEVITYISQLQWHKIKVGQKVIVSEENISGIVTRIDQNRDALTGLYKAQIKLEKPLASMVRKNLVLDIKVNTIENVLQIPSSSVKTDTESKYVWVVDKNNALRKNIKTGQRSGEFVQVLSGLEENEKVIVRGASLLQKNDQLRIVNSDGEKL